MDDMRDGVISLEGTDLMIKRLEKAADTGFKMSYVDGQPVRDVIDGAPVLKVGLSFLPGADRPTVARLEQTSMINTRAPDQMDALWRVTTAGSLLSEFEVTQDFHVVQKDRTAEIAKHAKERLSRRSILVNSGPVIIRGRPVDAVTIDSEEVKIVHDLRKQRGEFDLESTLIEVDGQSLMHLIVRYRILIQQGGPTVSLDDTKDMLETMMEDVRRLCHRSPILFRMSTRNHIITSKNTRYGINHGRQFTTLTTSKGIQEIISLSAAYYNTLDSDERAQKFIRPRFLQMLVLLLSLLNDDDLSELRDFLEATYKFKADRPNIELLFLKVIPLLSINSKVFLTSLVPAFEGYSPKEPLEKDFTHYWDTFISRILPLGYILPGAVEQLGRNPMSWGVMWPEHGFKSSDIFVNLQYAGELRTFNDIPTIDDLYDMYEKEDETSELTAIFTNDQKYIIRATDYERIVCLMPGKGFSNKR
jgi:hypothetical protein